MSVRNALETGLPAGRSKSGICGRYSNDNSPFTMRTNP
jgi:hypothetical protein